MHRIAQIVSLAGIVVCLNTTTLAAQKVVKLSAGEVHEIIASAVPVAIPPGESFGQLPIAKRKVYFDFERTAVAFGLPKGTRWPIDSLIKAPVMSGTQDLTSDCRQVGGKPCAKLGWSVYASVTPIAISRDTAAVYVHASWPARDNSRFSESAAPVGDAYLNGFSLTIHLRRDAKGHWRYSHTGPAMVGD